MNFLPEKLQLCYDYECSWGKQEEVAKDAGLHRTDNQNWSLRDAMQAQYLFGENAHPLYHTLPREDRCGMFYVLDDGWDVPLYSDLKPGETMPFGTIDPPLSKFPGFGDTPTERLKTICEKVRELGYAGTGLWICTQTPNENKKSYPRTPEGRKAMLADAKAYWEERAAWCQEAGIRYWKIDWGIHCSDTEYREMMTEVLHRVAPDIMVEHAFEQLSYRDQDRRPQKRILTRENLKNSDVFRLMDLMPEFWHTSGPDRADEILSETSTPNYNCKGYVQAEECYAFAAIMGFTVGVLWPKFEQVRIAPLWHRVAPPFTIYEAPYRRSEKELINTRYFPGESGNWATGFLAEVKTPAIMTRGCELPEVHPCDGLDPFVCASHNPRTGVCSIGTLPRMLDPSGWLSPMADITFKVGDPKTLTGLFGDYSTMTLIYDREIPLDGHVMMQNLFDTEARDITEYAEIEGNRLKLDGRILRMMWKESKNSISSPISQMVAIL